MQKTIGGFYCLLLTITEITTSKNTVAVSEPFAGGSYTKKCKEIINFDAEREKGTAKYRTYGKFF